MNQWVKPQRLPQIREKGSVKNSSKETINVCSLSLTMYPSGDSRRRVDIRIEIEIEMREKIIQIASLRTFWSDFQSKSTNETGRRKMANWAEDLVRRPRPIVAPRRSDKSRRGFLARRIDSNRQTAIRAAVRES